MTEPRPKHLSDAEWLNHQALADEEKSREELVTELQTLRGAYLKKWRQSRNRGVRLQELERLLQELRGRIVR
ncbi:hypothetical protein GCM10010385_58250 [Streptomyces geysiriensis]|nr:hypothetical protein GCM10010385_58250 [Streptomyces geysiriensis]